MKRYFQCALILLISSAIFISCKKDKGDPPALPPAETMIIDFSNFTGSTKGTDFTTDIKGTENSTYEYAALVAGVWKLIINTTLFVPVTAFKASLTQTPEYLDNKTWQWTYNITIASVTYTARLTGQIGATEILWKMYISKNGNGAYTDFLWFEGTSEIDGTSGQWILYQSPQAALKCLQIDWTKSGNSVSKVVYTWIKNNDPFKTSYIEYGVATGSLDSYFTVHYYTGSKFSDVEIKWDSETKNGRIRSLEYLENKWYCWDSNYVNVTCTDL